MTASTVLFAWMTCWPMASQKGCCQAQRPLTCETWSGSVSDCRLIWGYVR